MKMFLAIAALLFASEAFSQESLIKRRQDDWMKCLKANITAANDRAVVGEIHFYCNSNSSVDDQQGEWIFYTADRFRADIYAPAAQLERMWMMFATRPQWFLITIGEGPEVPQLSTNYFGDFRFSYRAGRIVPPDER